MFNSANYSPKAIKRGLLNGLVDYWPLTEQSGVRSSLTGRNYLADNNTVTGNPGLFGQASQFTKANLEFLAASGAQTELEINTDPATIIAWFFANSKPASKMQIVSKMNFSAGFKGYAIYWDNTTDRISLEVSSDTSATSVLACNNFGALVTSTWNMVCFQHFPGKSVELLVNNVTPNSLVWTAGNISPGSEFDIGRQDSTTTTCFDGRIVGVGFWKRILSYQEISFIYNNGLGRPLFSL